jgi:hypothetical protein
MDPNANLEAMRRVAERILNYRDDVTPMEVAGDAGRLADLVVALDEWITKGGFLPKEWQPKKPGRVSEDAL